MFIGSSNHWTGGSRVRFLLGAWKFPLSRASMVSPPSKLKMFTGNVCVLLTIASVSLKLSFRSHICEAEHIVCNAVYNMIWEELALVKQNGPWKPRRKKGFYPPNGLNFQFCWFNLIFLIAPSWSKSNFIYLFCFFIRSELVRVDPSWSDPDWRSELIRSDFCTCLFLFVCFLIINCHYKSDLPLDE